MHPGGTLRLFLAVDLDEGIRRGLVRAQARLREAGAMVRWVEEENLHFTLKFVGEMPAATLPEICRTTERLLEGLAPFTVTVRGTGRFPRAGVPRVVWAGVEEPTGGLEEAYHRLNDGLAPLGVPREERRFSPHLTIGRVRSGERAGALEAALEGMAGLEFGFQEVSEVVLKQSELDRSGPTYTDLARFALAAC